MFYEVRPKYLNGDVRVIRGGHINRAEMIRSKKTGFHALLRCLCLCVVSCVYQFTASCTDRMDVAFQSQSEKKKMCFGLICDRWENRICVSELANTQSKE